MYCIHTEHVFYVWGFMGWGFFFAINVFFLYHISYIYKLSAWAILTNYV